MNDEEFKKKLDRILETLYQIDREAREAVERERSQLKDQEHKTELPQRKDNQERTEKPQKKNYSEYR